MLCWCNICAFFGFSVLSFQLSKLVGKGWRNNLLWRTEEIDFSAFQKLITLLYHIAWGCSSRTPRAKISLSALLGKHMKSQAENLWESIKMKNLAAEVNAGLVVLTIGGIGGTGKKGRDLGSSWRSAPVLSATHRAFAAVAVLVNNQGYICFEMEVQIFLFKTSSWGLRENKQIGRDLW